MSFHICSGLRRAGLALAMLAILSGCATQTPPPARQGAWGQLPATPPSATPAPPAPATPAPKQPTGRALPPILSEILPVTADIPTVAPLTAPVDLWDRIRRGFAMQDLDTDLVRDREQWYASRPDYIQRMTERSSRYLFHIVEELERRNMPSELALLPFIESAFNPQAVSSARAAGMWQFMPATGQSFDLKQNIFRDDRRDVLASTRAALDYLQQLHARFGDWHLALAAYNWGQGNVNRAITRNQQAGLPTGYNDLNMPTETRYYVPKLQAVKNIVARPEAFAATLPHIGNHPFFDTIALERDIDVEVIARLSGVTERDFRALNPSLKQPLVMAAGTPNILLPWDNAITFTRNLQTHSGPLASWTAWVVPATMTVAQAAERVGMSESELRSVNNIPPRMKLREGSSLLVPRSQRRDVDVPEHVADNGHISLAPEIVLRKTTVRARKGDNLARLAARYGVSAASAAGWNKLAVNAKLKTGQRVTLMLPRSVKVAAPAASQRGMKIAQGKSRQVAKTAASRPTKNQAKGRSQAAAKVTAKVSRSKTTKAPQNKAKSNRKN